MKNASSFKGSLAAALIVAIFASVGSALETATWSSWSGTSATGSLAGLTISASTNSDAEFVGFTGNHFALFDGDCGEWDGQMGMGLSHDDEGVIASYVNGGDYQEFTFSSALTDGLFYIENFDSGSMAMLTATGATGITVLDQSKSITYASSADNMGTLSSSNLGYDGEGDAKILLSGDVTSLRIDYKAGEGANGVVYTFAKEAAEPNPVPEPTSLLVMAGLFSLGGFAAYRRRKTQ